MPTCKTGRGFWTPLKLESMSIVHSPVGLWVWTMWSLMCINDLPAAAEWLKPVVSSCCCLLCKKYFKKLLLFLEYKKMTNYWRLFAASKALWIVAIQLLQHFEVMLLRARNFAKISIYCRVSKVLIKNSFNKVFYISLTEINPPFLSLFM